MRNGNKKFHLSWKHGIALLLAVVLIMTMMMPAALGAEDGGEATGPKVHVVASIIDGEPRTLEVGLSIDSGSGTFQSAGVLLSYNKTKLVPVNWDTELKTESDIAVTAGDAPVVVPTQGADDLSGKLAEAAELGGVNYLFLSAEARHQMAYQQMLPTATTHPSGDENAADYPAKTTTAQKDVSYTDEAEGPVEQVVVARFRIVDPTGEGATPLTLADLVGALDIVQVDAGNQADVRKFPLSGIGTVADSDAVSYLADNTTYGDAGSTSTAPVDFRWVLAGKTANSGGADLSNVIPVLFFDADGVTLIGSAVISASANDTDLQKAMADFTKTVQDTANPDKYDPAYPLNSHNGYTFKNWVPMDPVDGDGNEAYTCYGAGISIMDAYGAATIAAPTAMVMPSETVSSVSVQAAYEANDKLASFSSISDPADHYYTVSVTNDDYLQFDQGAIYSITVRLQRGHYDGADWVPVPRVRKLGVRIGMEVTGAAGTVYMLQELDNQDDLTATFAVNDQASKVTVEVVDLCSVAILGGTENWATASIQRSNKLELYPEDQGDQMGFIRLSAIGYINAQCREATALGEDGAAVRGGTSSKDSLFVIMTTNYTAAGLNVMPAYNKVTGAPIAAPPLMRLRHVFANILDMYQSVNRNLTWDEMQEAIKRGTVWDPTLNSGAGGWTNDFTGTYAP